MSFGRLTLSFSSISIRRFNALMETRSSRSPQPHCPDGLPDARPDAGNHRRRTLHALRARPGPDKVRSRTQRPRHPPSGRLLGAASDGLFFAGRSRTHLPHCLRRQRRFCVSAARHARHHEEGPGLHFELTVPGGEIFAQLRSGEIDFTIFPFETFRNIRFTGTRRQVRCTFRRRLQDFGFYLSDAAPGARRSFPCHVHLWHSSNSQIRRPCRQGPP